MRANLAWVLAALGAILAAYRFESYWGQPVVTALAGALAAAIGLAPLRSRRGAASRGWILICIGILLNSVGGLAANISTSIGWTSAPTLGDLFWLALYPCVGAGIVLLVRARGHLFGGVSTLDAATLTVGLSLLCWVVLIRPAAQTHGVSALARLVIFAYPIGDLALMAILVRLLLSARRSRPLIMLTAGVCCFLGTDVAWSVLNQSGVEVIGAAGTAALSATPMIGYLLCGFAAAQRSVAAGRPPSQERPAVSNWLLVMLSVALLVAPLTLLAEAAAGQVHDAVAIAVCAGCLSVLVILRLAQVVRILQRQSVQLHRMSVTDPLTGLANRRHVATVLPSLATQSALDGQPLTAIVLDLDHFKQFNDEYGHQAGDQLLSAAAAAWAGMLREGDFVARLGGEEFLAVLSGTTPAQAAALCERLRAVTPLAQTFSAGIACWREPESLDQFLARADDAMYEAKRAGRNRFEIAAAERADEVSLA